MRRWMDWREGWRQKSRARAAFSAYARNGWESPWIKKHSLLEAIFHR